jgi:hypothetical protein
MAVGSARKPKVEAVRDALAVFGPRIDEESATLRASYACFQIGDDITKSASRRDE